MGQLSRLLVEYEVVLLVEYLVLRRGAIAFSLLLVHTENALFNQYLGEFDPIEKVEVLKECQHLTSSQMVCHCRFEQFLFSFITVSIRNGCKDLEARHANLNIELVFEQFNLLDFLDKVNFQWCIEVVISNDTRYCFEKILSQKILIKFHFNQTIFFNQGETLPEYVLDLTT